MNNKFSILDKQLYFDSLSKDQKAPFAYLIFKNTFIFSNIIEEKNKLITLIRDKFIEANPDEKLGTIWTEEQALAFDNYVRNESEEFKEWANEDSNITEFYTIDHSKLENKDFDPDIANQFRIWKLII